MVRNSEVDADCGDAYNRGYMQGWKACLKNQLKKLRKEESEEK